MASEAVIMDGVALLLGAYPQMNRDSNELKAARLRVFKATFTDIEDQLLIAAIAQLIAERDSEWPPSAGQIRNKAIRLRALATAEDAVDEYEAWALTQAAIAHIGFTFGTEEAIREFITSKTSPAKAAIVIDAIKRISWRELCMCDVSQLNTLRAQFRDTVTALQSRESEQRTMLPQVRAILQQTAARLDMNRARQLPQTNGVNKDAE